MPRKKTNEWYATETKAFMFITNVLLSFFLCSENLFARRLFFFFFLVLCVNQWADSTHTHTGSTIDDRVRVSSNISRMNGRLTPHVRHTYMQMHRRYNLSCDSLNSNEPESAHTGVHRLSTLPARPTRFHIECIRSLLPMKLKSFDYGTGVGAPHIELARIYWIEIYQTFNSFDKIVAPQNWNISFCFCTSPRLSTPGETDTAFNLTKFIAL